MSYAGGGFMAGGSQGGSQSSPGEGKRTGTSALRPVTIAQVASASQSFAESEFFIDGAEVKDVTVVACIRNVANTTSQVTLLIEDGTGQIDARLWKDPNEAENLPDDFPINSYVRIIGTLKTFSNKRHIAANRFRKITDHNEVLFHAVECIYVHKYYTQGPPGGAKMQDITHTTYDGGANPYAGGAVPTAGVSDVYNDLPQNQRAIMTFIATRAQDPEQGEEGVHVEAIVRQVGGSEAKIRTDIATLIEDGHLYETIDDQHVLPTAS
ncbi:hypothetical protein JCM10908_004176 [Rhodotorula pacifica]|uniref:Rfa2p n=1 Tax=Rhodotorula pacifica TaxID=1495444 RepID=UPI00316E2B9E